MLWGKNREWKASTTEIFSSTCVVHSLEDCEGWLLSGCCSSVADWALAAQAMFDSQQLLSISSHSRMYQSHICRKPKLQITSWHLSLQHTFRAAQVSRVWTPPIPSTHSSHPSLWNQTWVAAVEHLWTLCCVSVALQKSMLWGSRSTTVNCEENIFDCVQSQ